MDCEMRSSEICRSRLIGYRRAEPCNPKVGKYEEPNVGKLAGFLFNNVSTPTQNAATNTGDFHAIQQLGGFEVTYGALSDITLRLGFGRRYPNRGPKC